MGAYSLTVNGTKVEVDVPDDTPLLWVLRDTLGMTGTKFGCGIMQCGACTVHLDGQPVRACGTLIPQAAGRSVTTIEGLSDDRQHPVQQAWIAEEGAAVRVLSIGSDHVCGGAPRANPETH